MKAVVLSTLGTLALAAPVGAQDHAQHAKQAPAQQAAKVQAAGVVKAVDAKAKTITLAHEPIPALGWPAMTMSFRVASPALLKSLRAGDRVVFDLQGQQITAIRRA